MQLRVPPAAPNEADTSSLQPDAAPATRVHPALVELVRMLARQAAEAAMGTAVIPSETSPDD